MHCSTLAEIVHACQECNVTLPVNNRHHCLEWREQSSFTVTHLYIVMMLVLCDIYLMWYMWYLMVIWCDSFLIDFFFYIQVPYAEMGSKILCFAIYDFDRFSKHDQIGVVKVPLNSVDLGRVVEEWRDLTSPESDSEKVISPCDVCSVLLYVSWCSSVVPGPPRLT